MRRSVIGVVGLVAATVAAGAAASASESVARDPALARPFAERCPKTLPKQIRQLRTQPESVLFERARTCGIPAAGSRSKPGTTRTDTVRKLPTGVNMGRVDRAVDAEVTRLRSAAEQCHRIAGKRLRSPDDSSVRTQMDALQRQPRTVEAIARLRKVALATGSSSQLLADAEAKLFALVPANTRKLFAGFARIAAAQAPVRPLACVAEPESPAARADKTVRIASFSAELHSATRGHNAGYEQGWHTTPANEVVTDLVADVGWDSSVDLSARVHGVFEVSRSTRRVTIRFRRTSFPYSFTDVSLGGAACVGYGYAFGVTNAQGNFNRAEYHPESCTLYHAVLPGFVPMPHPIELQPPPFIETLTFDPPAPGLYIAWVHSESQTWTTGWASAWSNHSMVIDSWNALSEMQS